jgi:DNA phosphorothioation-dependent restriction protein DptG
MENRLKQDLEKTYNLIESWLDMNEAREKIKKFSNIIII